MPNEIKLEITITPDPMSGWGQKAQDFIDALKAGHGFPHYIKDVKDVSDPDVTYNDECIPCKNTREMLFGTECPNCEYVHDGTAEFQAG